MHSVSADHVDPVLKKLRFDNGTGPGQISTRVLRRCHLASSVPIALLCNWFLDQGIWPDKWRHRWMCPLHKRKSKADRRNYRGAPLTSQLTKVCERALGPNMRRWLESAGLYGPRQLAYMKGAGHRDALLANILQWMWWIETGHVVALYCSDVSGALDRVHRELLVRKIRSTRVSGCMARVLESWLDDRSAEVIV